MGPRNPSTRAMEKEAYEFVLRSSIEDQSNDHPFPICLPFDQNFDCNVNALNNYDLTDVYSVDFDGKALGEGGYGTVYRGQHLFEVDMPVAIKKITFGVMRRGYDDGDGDYAGDVGRLSQRRLIQSIDSQIKEIVILKRFRNDHRMVHMHEYFVSTETDTRITSLYIVTEFLQGGELFYCIKNRIKEQQEQQNTVEVTQPFCEGDVRDIFLVLMDAIHFMHRNGVIHRDLKPSNLLLQVRDNPTSLKIADFGQSKELKPEEKTRTSCGTPGYRPPEMYLGEMYREGVDLFSAACILFFLLAGYQPFASYPKHKIRNKTLRCEYRTDVESWNRVSSSAKSLVKCLLTKSDRRLTTAQTVLDHEWMQVDEEADFLKRDLTENAKALLISLEQEISEDEVQAKLDFQGPSPDFECDGVQIQEPEPPGLVRLETRADTLPAAPLQSQEIIPPVATPVEIEAQVEQSNDEERLQANGDKGVTPPMCGLCSCLFGLLGKKKVEPRALPTPTPNGETPEVAEPESLAPVASPPMAAVVRPEALVAEENTSSGFMLPPSLAYSQSIAFVDSESRPVHIGTDVPDNMTLLLKHILNNVASADYTEAVARTYIHKILEAVAGLHASNIVHRNITFENLLASEEGIVILKDMRYACEIIPGENSLSGYCGTPYVTTAPEVYTDFSYNEKVDVWSVGVITYLLLCGIYPFFGTGDEPEVRRLAMQIFFPFSRDAPTSKARDFVRRLLRPNPSDRPSMRDMLQHEWMLEDESDLANVSLEFAYGGLGVGFE